ncbi:neurotensin receptor type 2-like [Lynx pardinus]|uniref:Neurotensin receptor type 2-like n=1 Tax=Lynx pardinus TaxID=191816 RepID=A0A485NDH8_LYNPA|nr:neurotensin receptor type 2-like [Lynx pardinus]
MAVITGQKHELEKAGGEPEPASRVCTVLVSRATLQVCIQVNVLVSFVLPLALTAFLNGVSVSHLVALSSQVPSLSAPGSPVPNHVELMSEERRKLPLEGHTSLVRHKDSSRLRGLQHSVQGLRAIVAMYVTCWMPSHTRRLMYRLQRWVDWVGAAEGPQHVGKGPLVCALKFSELGVGNKALSTNFKAMRVRDLSGDQGYGHPDHRIEPPTGWGRGRAVLWQGEGRKPQSRESRR